MNLEYLATGDSVRYKGFDWIITHLDAQNDLLVLNDVVKASGKDVVSSVFWFETDEHSWDLRLQEHTIGKLLRTHQGFSYGLGMDKMDDPAQHVHIEGLDAETVKRQVIALCWEWLGK